MYRRLQRRLLRSVRKTVFVPFEPFVFPAAPASYVFCDQIQFIIIFSEIMFLMFVLSNMLESRMLGLVLVMLNLVRNLNLQLSIFPTIQKPYYRQSVDLTMAGFAESLVYCYAHLGHETWQACGRTYC